MLPAPGRSLAKPLLHLPQFPGEKPGIYCSHLEVWSFSAGAGNAGEQGGLEVPPEPGLSPGNYGKKRGANSALTPPVPPANRAKIWFFPQFSHVAGVESCLQEEDFHAEKLLSSSSVGGL